MDGRELKRVSVALLSVVLVSCGGVGDANDAPSSDGQVSSAQKSTTLAVQVVLQPTTQDFPNPERGLYRFVTDPAQITATSLQYVVNDGQRLVYTPADLSNWRSRDLPATYLTKLNTGFANLRKQGLKAVLRFAYNYPETEAEYLNARDATLARVKRHITQLTPVLQANADVIAVMQAGFIGAWGEWHTSSNGLTSDANKAAVRDALLAALPTQRLLHVRYPADLMLWYSNPVTLGQMLANPPGPVGRIGLHNDCFMASPDDVGTYFAEEPAQSAALRHYAQQATAAVGAGGETCAPPVVEQARMRCQDILAEGAAYHMSYLNRDYYEGFFLQWQAEGCMADVTKKLGYRLELHTVGHAATATPGGTLDWSVAFTNQGWARPINARSLVLYLVSAGGQITALPLAGTDLRQATPSQPIQWAGSVALPASLAPGSYQVRLGAPDAAPTLAAMPAYAIRFANADVPASGMQWLPAVGQFALGSTVQIQ